MLEQERAARESRRSRLEAALPGMVEQLKALGARRVVLFGSLARGKVGCARLHERGVRGTLALAAVPAARAP